jgi:hypothetical protein
MATKNEPDDEMRRRYLEALERKRSGGAAGNAGHTGPKQDKLANNDKTKRTFRRKSG